jgi:hypothetical protein
MTSAERREKRYQRRLAERGAKRKKNIEPYDNFKKVMNFDNLNNAFKRCKRGVSWKESVQRYEMNSLHNILETQYNLLEGRRVTSGFVEFDLHERGKKRHIKSIHISERVVQKCLCDEVLVPILSKSLIHDNGASVKRKGVHFALRRLICHLAKFYRKNNYSNSGYALKIDFKRFFDSVDHEVLFEMLDEKIHDHRIQRLARSFIKVFGNGVSLGLGSQVSQICAIYFPSRLDHYIKERLGIKFYGRYMDDLYLIHADKEHLKKCLKEIITVCEKLKILVNMKKTSIVKLSQGLVFLKGRYSLLPSGKVLRRPCQESAKRMKKKLTKFKKLLQEKKIGFGDIRASYQSWRGNYKRRFHAYHRIRHMDGYYNSLFINEH